MTTTCQTCGTVWDASRSPYCPKCIASKWDSTPDLIRPKHDPGALPSGYPSFRSVVTDDVVQRRTEFLEYSAASGEWFYSTHHQKYCVFTPDPLGSIPGSGIPRGDTMPTHALDGLVIADATQDAHLFTADQVRFRNDVSAGLYQPLPYCCEPGCHRRAVPGEQLCVVHKPNPHGY